MTSGSLVNIDGVTYQVNFRPNQELLVRECPQTIQEEPSSSSFSDDSSSCCSSSSSTASSVEEDVQQKKETTKKKKKKRFGFSLSFKLKKKNKSKKPRTNKKIKGKSKMALLFKSSAANMEPSESLFQKWKASVGGYSEDYEDDEDFEYFSGSLFAGRLHDDDDITKLPTIRETCELQEPSSLPRKKVITQNLVVEERTKQKGWKFVIRKTREQPSPSPSRKNKITQNLVVEERKSPSNNKKGWKLVKRIFMKLHVNNNSSQNSVADTCTISTTSSPRTMVDDDDHHHHIHHDDDDADHSAIRDDDDSVYALASVEETFFSLNSELSTYLHQEDQLVSSSTSEDDLPPSLTLTSSPSSVSATQPTTTNCVAKFVWKGRVPEAEYPSDEEDCSVNSIMSPVPSLPAATASATTEAPRKKILNYKKSKKTTTTTTSEAKPATTAMVKASGWNALALLLVAVLCAISIASRLMMIFGGADNLSQVDYCLEVEASEWPFDECLSSEAPVTSSSYISYFFW